MARGGRARGSLAGGSPPAVGPAHQQRTDAEGEERQRQGTREGPEHYARRVFYPALRTILGQAMPPLPEAAGATRAPTPMRLRWVSSPSGPSHPGRSSRTCSLPRSRRRGGRGPPRRISPLPNCRPHGRSLGRARGGCSSRCRADRSGYRRASLLLSPLLGRDCRLAEELPVVVPELGAQVVDHAPWSA